MEYAEHEATVAQHLEPDGIGRQLGGDHGNRTGIGIIGGKCGIKAEV